MLEGLQLPLKILLLVDSARPMLCTPPSGLNRVPAECHTLATVLRCTLKALECPSHTSVPKTYLVLKLKVRAPQMSPGSQAHQDVAFKVVCPPHLCRVPPLPRSMKSFLHNGLHVGQWPRARSHSSAFSVIILLQP